MWLISEAEISEEKRKYATHFTVHYVFFENDHVDWYILVEDNKRISEKILSLAAQNPDISKTFLKGWETDEKRFFKKCKEIGKLNLPKLNDTELITLHDEFCKMYIRSKSSSSTIDGFALGTDEIIADKIKKLYDEKKPAIRYTELFSKLTAPVHLSFINEAELSFLRAAKSAQLLKKHQKDYFWIKNNYVNDEVLSVNYFKEQLNGFDGLDVKKEIEKIESTPLENEKMKKQLIKELSPDDELLSLIRISEDFTYWQDERKRSTLWATHYFSIVLGEIAKRVGVTLHEIKYMTPSEVNLIFTNKPDRKVLQERIKNSVYYMDKDGTEALFGKDADKVKKKLLTQKDALTIDDFRGLTACMGKVIGRVKIIKSAKEIGKVVKGDILVAVMTRPDYIPAMKVAAAIVTDEGGVTSHAAIVSRELGVPCIIGTKIATKVLRDGQLVEVNANHGWVRILERK
jgi:phosphohistidine swiveling domain-containing protein